VKIIQSASLNVRLPGYTFNGMKFGDAKLVALRPLAALILTDYGSPTTDMLKIAAIVDWTARIFIHEHPTFHPNGSSGYTTVLPAGETWTTFNTAMPAASAASNAFWSALAPDGYNMLDAMLGTLNVGTGVRAANGMMTQVGGTSQYKINSLATYKAVLCTNQNRVVQALLAALGYHSMQVSTNNHDGMATFVPQYGKWAWNDPTFNEWFATTNGGTPMSPAEINAYARAGLGSSLVQQRGGNPSWNAAYSYHPQTYFSAAHGINGFKLLVGYLQAQNWGGSNLLPRYVKLKSVEADAYLAGIYANDAQYKPTDSSVMFPKLGCGISKFAVDGLSVQIELGAQWRGPGQFYRKVGAGAFVLLGGSSDVVPVGAGRVTYRFADNAPFSGMEAIIDV
jgi:hypothetical protein